MIKIEQRGLPAPAPRTMAEVRGGTRARELRTLVAVAERTTLALETSAPELIVRTSGHTRALGCWWTLRYS